MSSETSLWIEWARELGGLAALTGIAALWLVATRRLRSGDILDRVLSSFVTLGWLAIVSFWLLASLGQFRLLPALVVLALPPLALLFFGRGTVRVSTPPTPLEPITVSPAARKIAAIVAIPWVIFVGLRFLKGLMAPPMAWDSLTYHLPKAALWVQTGGLDLLRLPDAWSYYRWFPAGSEILMAWLMLPTRSDILLGPFGALVWLLLVLAARALTRELGAGDDTAWLAGFAFATLPCLLSFVTSGYADNAELLLILLSFVYASRFLRDGLPTTALFAAASIGLAIAVKTTGIVVAPVVAVLIAVGWRRHPGALRWWLPPAMIAAVLVPAAGYLQVWWETGSPLYPVRVPFFEGLSYHQGLHDLQSGAVLPDSVKQSTLFGKLIALFWSEDGPNGHLNFGLGGLLLALLALAGSIRSFARESANRRLVAASIVVAVATTPLFFGSSSTALHTLWMGVSGRLVIAGVGAFLLTSASLPRPVALGGLGTVSILNLFHAQPLGYSPAVMAAVVPAAGLLITVSAAVVLIVRRWRPPRYGSVLLVSVAIVMLYPTLSLVRDAARYPIWRETAAGGSAFDSHALTPAFSMIAPVAEALDDGTPKRLAITAGVIGTGHNQFLYPMFGRRLTNELVYIVTTAGANDDELDAQTRLERAARGLWLERLDAEDPDFVVTLWPEAPEWEWVKADPERFEILDVGEPGFYQAARVR